jgi:hypothetical protein
MAWLSACVSPMAADATHRVPSGLALAPEESANEGARFDDSGDGDTRSRTESFFDRGTTADRRVVYTASLTVEVARVDDAIARCQGTVTELGGYIARRDDGTLTCRVPADRSTDIVTTLKGYGRVLRESMQAQDITKEYLDVEIRLDNARRARDRLLALLERADKVTDILEIEAQLRRLTEEIERTEGELRYLKDQVMMSTVTVTFAPVAPPTRGGNRRPSRFDWINRVGVEHVLRDF